jgi:hypothetical protein
MTRMSEADMTSCKVIPSSSAAASTGAGRQGRLRRDIPGEDRVLATTWSSGPRIMLDFTDTLLTERAAGPTYRALGLISRPVCPAPRMCLATTSSPLLTSGQSPDRPGLAR